jgi:acyl-CoA synthetase (AMP-forming)/AMP-acid ligase II
MRTLRTNNFIGDLRYQILTLALSKAGYKILLNSPRNSIEGHINVIQKIECNTWLLPSQNVGNISEVLKVHPMRVFDCPDLDFFIDETPVEHYPYNKTWAESSTEPILVLHTSGSTGLPKPIILRHALGAVLDAQNLIKMDDGKKLYLQIWQGVRVFSAFPAFHVST